MRNIALIFMLASGNCFLKAQEVVIPNTVDLWADYISILPDCSFEYSVTLQIPDEESNHQRVCEFTRYGDMFIQKEFSPEGAVQEIVSFDGNSFYSMFDSGSQLTISSGTPEHNQRFAQRFKFNPLFVPLAALSEGAFGLFKNDFYPPVIADPKIYEQRLAQLKTGTPKLGENGLSWKISHNGAGRDFISRDMHLTDLESVVTKTPSYGNLAERWRFDLVRPITVPSGVFPFPLRIVREYLDSSGKVDSTAPTCIIEVDRDSVRIHDSPLDVTVFRVPKSMARILRDSDVGVSIPLNRDIQPE